MINYNNNIDSLKKYKHVHMIGIGGISMSGIAEILHNFGIFVTGSDVTRSKITDKLSSHGIFITIGHDTKLVSQADLVVYSAAVKQDDPELLEAKKNNIEIVSILDDEYPNILRNIYDPPIFLYLKGNKKILNKMSIAIIGCREARDYGKKIAKNFAYNLSKNNINIISGLAKGIDTCAHLGAIYAKEKTIAVLGSGINVIYPKENLYLVQKILENEGVIISEYPLGTAPEKRNFVARNRIISGMSRGVLVVEAKKKSGTLITVDFALNEGRDIFVIPGDISSENSFGTNDLIKQGGKLVTDFTEILEEYEFK